MNKSIKTIFLLFVILIAFLKINYSQELLYQKFEFNTKDTIDYEKFGNKYSAVILDENIIYEYQYEDGTPYLYETIAKKILLLDRRGVEGYNVVYIPLANVVDLVDISIKTISPTGETVITRKDNIKTVENLDNKGAFKIFAVDGVEVNGIVELVYTLKKMPVTAGRYIFQNKYPTLKARFELRSPQNLIFESKAYNTSVQYDEIISSGKLHHLLSLGYIPEYKEERYAAWRANQVRVDYSLMLNTGIDESGVSAWNKIAKRLHEQYCVFSKEEKKIAKKHIRKLKLNKLSDKDKIVKIENYIKNSVRLQTIEIDDLQALSFALNYGIANDQAMIKLTTLFLETANIEYKLGFTSDRFVRKFDVDFSNYLNLNEPVIFLPSTNQHIMPLHKTVRMGDMIPEYSDNNGLFVSVIKTSKFESVFHEFRYIPGNKFENNFSKQYFVVEFDSSLSKVKTDYEYSLSGTSSRFIRPYYDLVNEEEQRKSMERIFQIIADDVELVSFNVENYDRNISSIDETFIVKAKLEIPSLVEKVGNDVIFNIGDIIGPQVEMYADTNRINDLELRQRHFYEREIRVKIPEGYSLFGQEQLIINNEYNVDGKNIMGFISTYELTEDELIVKISEYYDFIFLSKKYYEKFRTVINSAADFNKISIVLSKH
jgi:hypothetical protein